MNYQPAPPPTQQQGFTLIELSIVLVIIGLLVSGVITGQNLINAAELRSISTEVTSFQTAVNGFQGKFMALPGDMNNATMFWGRNTTHCGSASGNDATPGTCNGDDDGSITGAGGALQKGENYLFWQHLALSGMIDGQYNGLSGDQGPWHAVIDENSPRSEFSGGGWWTFTSNNALVMDNRFFYLDFGNHFIIGAQTASDATEDPLLTPIQALNVDIKMDDGHPAKGSIVASNWNNECSEAIDGVNHAADNFESQYKGTVDTVECALVFRRAY